jgi:pimeloyl-ACP methyl ester carboxylesterase
MSPLRSVIVRSPLPCHTRLRIAVRVEGEGDPLLLINGMTRPLKSWDPFTKELRGRRVISFDTPGVGGSPTPLRPLSITELGAVTMSVLDAVGVDAADVLGYSHGGAVAQQLAHDVPARVRRLILVATSCGVGATPGTGGAILRGLGGPVEGNAWPIPDLLGMFWQSLAVSAWSSIPFLGTIQAPTLVVCGSRDRVVPPCNSKVLARRIPDASLRLLPGGHDVQRGESAKELAKLVEDFLSPARTTERLRITG